MRRNSASSYVWELRVGVALTLWSSLSFISRELTGSKGHPLLVKMTVPVSRAVLESALLTWYPFAKPSSCVCVRSLTDMFAVIFCPGTYELEV